MAKDKKKKGTSRNNAVFRVVGAKVSKQSKGKPKEVGMKLKKVTFHQLRSTHVDCYGQTLADYQQESQGRRGEPRHQACVPEEELGQAERGNGED